MLSIQKNLTNSFYAMLSLPSTAMGFALSVQISALSWLLSTQFGLDLHEIGIVWAAGPIAGILGQVIIGVISDKVWFWNGRRRPFILIGGFTAAMSLLALPNIGIISQSLGSNGIIAVAIAVALTLDLSINISFNPTRSIIADVTPEGSARTRGYTIMQTVSGTFGVLAYAIGWYWDNFVLIYFGAALVLLLSILPPLFVEEPKELHSDDEEATHTMGFPLGQIIKDIRPLWGFIAYAIYISIMQLMDMKIESYWDEAIALLIALYFVFETLATKEAGKSLSEAKHISYKKVLAAHSFSWIGVQTMFIFTFAFLRQQMPEIDDIRMGQVNSFGFLLLNLVGALLPAFVLGPIANRIGRIKTHSIALFIMAVAYALISIVETSAMSMYLLMAMAGVGWSAIISLPFAVMSERVEQSKMGLYMGLFNLSVVIPQLVVSLGVGLFLRDIDDKSAIFLVCAASLLISAISWMTIKETVTDDKA